MVVILALLVQSASTFAAAGVVNVVMCCCPDIESCKCHEHDAPTTPTQVNRCGGAIENDAPILVAITLPTPPAPTVVDRHTVTVEYVLPAIPDDFVVVPEKPPF